MAAEQWRFSSIVMVVCGLVTACGQSAHPGVLADASQVDDSLVTKCSNDGITLSGVDVSTFQGTAIDWPTVAASGTAFAIAKVSEGLTIADDAFPTNWPGIQGAGLVRGAYHFFHPSDDPVGQVTYMLGLIDQAGGLQVGDLPPVLDVEVTDGLSASEVVSALTATIAAVHERTRLTPIVYASPSFWQTTLADPKVKATLWIANWQTTCPELPNAFSNWAFWQSSSTGTVSTIPGAVDLDEFNGDQNALWSMTIQAIHRL